MSSNESVELTTTESLGAILREAREKAGMSLDEISVETLIPLARLVALEEGDFERVGGSAYVIGYARNTAECIGVDPEPIVRAFTELINAESNKRPTPEDPTSPVPELILPHRLKAMLIVVGVALVVVIFTLIVLLTGSGDSADSSAGPIEGNVEPEAHNTASERVSTTEVTVMERDTLKLAPPKTDIAAVKATVVETPTVAALPSAEVLSDADEVHEPEVRLVEQGGVQFDKPSVTTVEPEPIIVDAPPVDVLVEAEDLVVEESLSIFFTDECWVKVTDATGKMLAARVANSGEHLNLVGLTPFEVMLGNAEAALVELNGESVNVTPRRGKRTLRLTVGG